MFWAGCSFKSNPMHPLSGCIAFAVYLPARATRGTLVAHRYSFAPPRCMTSAREALRLLVVSQNLCASLGVSLERS